MKILKYIVYAAFGVVALSNCSKQLDLVPTDSINENNAYRTIADAQLGANAVYGRYFAFSNDIFVSALMADEIKLGADNAGQGALTYRYQISAESGDLTGGFAGYYSVIDQANRVLKALPNVIVSGSGEEDRRKVLTAQMQAMRGIAYFGLLQSFCKNYDPNEKGVSLILTPNPLAQVPRSSMGEVMASIDKDLKDAYDYFTATTPTPSASNFTDTVMNRVNVRAYMAKVALFKKNYTDAVSFSSDVIGWLTAINKPMVTGAAYSSIWVESPAAPTYLPEVLFRVRNVNGTGLGGFWTTTTNLVYFSPSDKLTDIYTSTIPGTQSDIRRSAFIGTLSGKPYVKKHEGLRSTGNRVVELKALRSSEMYLIRAEAYAKQTSPNLAAGTTDLNALRTQRITGYTNVPTFATASDLINAIVLERYKEFCFEGSRLFDLKRNGMDVTRAATDVTSTAWQVLSASDFKFVMPIPQVEILANPNAVQNPGY